MHTVGYGVGGRGAPPFPTLAARIRCTPPHRMHIGRPPIRCEESRIVRHTTPRGGGGGGGGVGGGGAPPPLADVAAAGMATGGGGGGGGGAGGAGDAATCGSRLQYVLQSLKMRLFRQLVEFSYCVTCHIRKLKFLRDAYVVIASHDLTASPRSGV